MTKGKRVSTKSLVNNPAFVARAIYSGQISVETLISEAVEDVSKFYTYSDMALHNIDYDLCKRLYKKMESISEKYPRSKSLKSKLEETSRRIWPQGRP